MSRYESIFPPKIKKGDRVGIVATSSPFDEEAFEQGLDCLRAMGLEPVMPDGIFARKGYLAGNDGHRVSMIHELFADPEIQAIFCARGGYGAMRLLGRIDGDLIRDNPKMFIGFSDASALLNQMYQAWGLVAFHGPVVCSLGRTDQASLEALKAMLFIETSTEITADQGWVLVPGKARGHLMGGNLATLCHLIGTPYQPDFSGAILMLEDVGEPVYKIDRMLTQMAYAGMFDQVQGVVMGSFEGCGDLDLLADLFVDVLGHTGVPLVMNVAFGHGTANRIFPIGAEARLDADALRIVF